MQNLLEPWVLLRLSAGIVAFALFARAALTAQKVLRRFDVRAVTEGQLALERQLELASTFARVGAVVQVLLLALIVLAGERMSRGVRGAMCAYGVFSAHPAGFPSLLVTALGALVAGVLTQVFAFDARVRSLSLARPLAIATCIMAPISLFDFVLAAKFLLGLDLSVVASCCSVELDAAATAVGAHAAGPRVLMTALAVGGVALSIASALFAARGPTRARVVASGILSLATLPVAVSATILEVAPHAFETPAHVCPFCLLKSDVLGLGYPLYAALLVGAISAVGAAVSALLAREDVAKGALATFVPYTLVRGALAWGCALLLGAAPVVRFMLLSGGVSLFGER